MENGGRMKKLIIFILALLATLSIYSITPVAAEELLLIHLPMEYYEELEKTEPLVEDTIGFLSEQVEIMTTQNIDIITYTSIYTEFNDYERELLFRVVEAEAYGCHYENYRNIANVIFNRMRSGWGNLITVLTSPYQFKVVTTGFYKTVKVSEAAIKACEDAWQCDYTSGAIYFNMYTTNSYASKHCKFLFRDSCGHNFYKEY